MRDLEIISKELRLKDVAAVEKIIEPLEKEVKRDGKAKEKKDRLEITQKVLNVLREQDKDVRFETWGTKETEVINDLHLLTAKPALYLINMSEKARARAHAHPRPRPRPRPCARAHAHMPAPAPMRPRPCARARAPAHATRTCPARPRRAHADTCPRRTSSARRTSGLRS